MDKTIVDHVADLRQRVARLEGGKGDAATAQEILEYLYVDQGISEKDVYYEIDKVGVMLSIVFADVDAIDFNHSRPFEKYGLLIVHGDKHWKRKVRDLAEKVRALIPQKLAEGLEVLRD